MSCRYQQSQYTPVSRCRQCFTLAPPLGPSLLSSRRSPPCLRVSGSFSVFKLQLTCHPYHSHLPATITQICLTCFISFNYHSSDLTIQLLALQSVFPPAPQHRSSKDGSFYLLYSPLHLQYAQRKDWSLPKVPNSLLGPYGTTENELLSNISRQWEDEFGGRDGFRKNPEADTHRGAGLNSAASREQRRSWRLENPGVLQWESVVFGPRYHM